MSAPDPEGMSMLAKVATAAAAILTPIATLYAWFDAKMAKKADQSALDALKKDVAEKAGHDETRKDFHEIRDELHVQRGHIGKIFDQMGAAERESEKRHRELMMHLLERKQ